jgi:DNA-binding transcriptional regulator YhcF (GntR family)
MKLWVAKNSEIPIKDQLIAQVRVAVAAGDLKEGDRLPSTREIARRFAVHPNTVSAAYRGLARGGDVVKRDGSGVFVAESNGRDDVLDGLIDAMLKGAEAYGIEKPEVLRRVVRRLDGSSGAAGFALFEPNPDLAAIVVHEVSAATGLPISVVGLADIAGAVERGIRLIALSDEKPNLDGLECTFLTANSVAFSMAGQTRPSPDDIVAIVSAWDDFLTFARLFLIAAKVDADSIVSVSAKGSGWQSKLRAASVIICDSVIGSHLLGDERVRVFPLVAQSSLSELSFSNS